MPIQTEHAGGETDKRHTSGGKARCVLISLGRDEKPVGGMHGSDRYTHRANHRRRCHRGHGPRDKGAPESISTPALVAA